MSNDHDQKEEVKGWHVNIMGDMGKEKNAAAAAFRIPFLGSHQITRMPNPAPQTAISE